MQYYWWLWGGVLLLINLSCLIYHQNGNSNLMLSLICDLLHLTFKANYNYCGSFSFYNAFSSELFSSLERLGRVKALLQKPCHIYPAPSDKVLSTLHKFFVEFLQMQILILILPFIWLSCQKIMIINNQVCAKCYLNRQSTYNLQLLFNCTNLIRHDVSSTKKCGPIEATTGIEQASLKILFCQKSALPTMESGRPP
jgi:hypothetical protein